MWLAAGAALSTYLIAIIFRANSGIFAMTQLETYRLNADAQRVAASNATLANRRAMHERAAEMWDTMAADAEDTAGRAIVNEGARAAR
jgi:hypothetical protein